MGGYLHQINQNQLLDGIKNYFKPQWMDNPILQIIFCKK